ncbi:hypothetical protein [Rhodococcus zopfii]|uniref:hypothetical protein n=1 Tax=Rhodococcus zopfii TaxID=43772 RepID=UPI0009332C02|nr:hypothetical protein [Rhodococcus zopfii]
MGEPWADHERLVDAADLFAEKVDVLLDRVVDSTIGPSTAHSPEQLRDDSAARLLTRIAIEHRAGVDPALDVQRALRAGMTWDQIGGAAGIGADAARARWSAGQPADPHPTPEPVPVPPEQARRRRPGRRRAGDDQQMSMF